MVVKLAVDKVQVHPYIHQGSHAWVTQRISQLAVQVPLGTEGPLASGFRGNNSEEAACYAC